MTLLLLLWLQDDPYEELLKLRRLQRERKAEAAALRWSAHQALDRGDYDEAESTHKKARALEAEIEKFRGDEERLVPKAVTALVKDLMHDSIDIRDRAASRLIGIGEPAIAPLERLLKSDDAEVRARAIQVLNCLRKGEVDDEGLLHQWASSAKASSEYQQDRWSAAQATGRPDTFEGGDAHTAWASLNSDSDEEWLELTYEVWVKPRRIRVHETFNPGAVSKIEAMDGSGKWHVLWAGKDTVLEAPGWLEVSVKADFACRVIKVTIDNDAVAGWNEIDAVELVGEQTAPPKKER
jgi:hypothetical protein